MEKSAEELLKAAATSTDEAAKVAELRAAIPATTAGIYLNAGSNGPLPREVDAAMRQVQEQELATGRGSEHVMDDVETRIDELRGVFASVLATDLDLVAVSHSTTEAVVRTVLGIEWKPGDRIVTLDEEYPAIRGSLAALAARLLGRPAKCRLDRDEDMMLTGKRHDFRVDYTAGFDTEGRVTAVDVDFLARCGYSADLSNAICDRTMFHADNAYFYPSARIATRRLRTNTVSNTAFRGFGGPQGMLFAERLMEVIAIRTGQDPLDVRKANLYGVKGSVTPYGMKVEDNIAPEIISELEASSDYRARRRKIARFNAKNAVLKKGISLTPVKFGISFTLTYLNQAGALVHVYTDGSVHLNHGGTEMGQGLYTKVAQVVAEEFGIAAAQVRITATTTGKVPNTSATAASSGTDLNGKAAQAACNNIKARLAAFVVELTNVSE